MQQTLKLLAGLITLATAAIAQEPIANGLYLVFARPATAGSTELFWDVSGGNTNVPVPGVTPILAQFLNELPPSTQNQQWMANFLVGLGGSSGLYTFNTALSPTDFFGLTTAGGAVVSVVPTLFNVTSAGRGIVTIQPVNSNMALTSNETPTEQVTTQPLSSGNALQLWNFS